MENYVLVKDERKGLRIGIKRYTKETAIARANMLKEFGIDLKVMRFQKACGVDN